MGKILTDAYEAIKKDGGITAQMRLAMMTGISLKQAATMPDSPDLKKKFSDAYREITGKASPIS